MCRIVRANPCLRAIQSVCKCPRGEGPSALDDLARRVHFDGEERQRVLHVLRLTLVRRSTGYVTLKCRSCKKGRSAPPVHMIKLTETREIAPYKWVHPDEEGR